MSYFERNGTINCRQFGFQKRKSTVSAAVGYVNIISMGLEQAHNPFTLFLVLSTAFYVVDQDILITKLEHYGNRGTLSVIKSYLQNKKQSVERQSKQSCMKTHKKFHRVAFSTSIVPDIVFIYYK